MNLQGVVEEGFPRVTLSLTGRSGKAIPILFVADTAFDGYLAVPLEQLAEIYTFVPTVSRIKPVHADPRDCVSVTAMLWAEGNREQSAVEVLVLENGNYPLFGVEFMWDHYLSVAFVREGEVALEEI